MILSDISIRRPVFATMVISAIVVFGIVLFRQLNVDMYPKVDAPIVTVTVPYPGAGPETVERQVIDPVEEALNGIAGVRSIRSTAVESVAVVVIEFSLEINSEAAAQEVRDRLATLESILPSGAESPLVQRLDLGAAPVMQLALAGDDLATLDRHARDVIVPALERLDGVGRVEVVGAPEREFHVWIDPYALRARDLTVDDISNALRSQSVEIPAGRIVADGHEMSVRTDAAARSVGDLGRIVVTTIDGIAVHLSDVARIENGSEEARSTALLDGRAAIAIVISKQGDANTVEVSDRIRAALPGLERSVPDGAALTTVVDGSTDIRGSIESVEVDLILGAILAIAIILLFLRDWRATLISALALPVSVLGAFGFVAAMGFTLNMMTTLALSLSIGILIDDAIVVIENIVRRRSVLGENANDAASRGTAEIGLAVLATTLSIVAVFVPVAFMEGLLGQFFYEFGLTVAFAVLVSLFVSFTLTPMLSARFLGAHDAHHKPKGISGFIDRILTGIERAYRAIIRWALGHRVITLGGAVVALGLTFAAFPLLGFEFVPPTDTARFVIHMETPNGTDLATTHARVAEVAERMEAYPWVSSTFARAGGGSEGRVDSGEVVVNMTPRDERELHQTEAMVLVREMLTSIEGIEASVDPYAALGSGGRSAPIQLQLQGDDLELLAAAADRIVERLASTPGFVDVSTTAEAARDELRVEVDLVRAADRSVTAQSIAMAARTLIAGDVATTIDEGGERVDVRVQLPPSMRGDIRALEAARVRSSTGARVELGAVADVRIAHSASRIERLDRARQITILANLDSIALGDAIEVAESIAADEVPPGTLVSMGGDGQMLDESVASMGLALILAILCVYMILASQFESFIDPFTIMVSLPFALIGAVGGLLVGGMAMSIFAMIGLIMLMGLVTKNAILLVDFAIQREREGLTVAAAVEDAGVTRLRPILMTTAAMIFGMIPVAVGHGDGGELRAPMGVAIIGGLITSTVLTLIVVPVIHSFVRRFGAFLRGAKDTTEDPAPALDAIDAAPAE